MTEEQQTPSPDDEDGASPATSAVEKTSKEPEVPLKYDDDFLKSIGMNPSLPKFAEDRDGIARFEANSISQVTECFGTKSSEFLALLLENCLNVSGKIQAYKEDKNFAIAIISEIGPKDAIESMLAVQMASVHLAILRHSRQMAAVETIAQLEVQERVFNKLTRTFTAQMEALRKHRHGGQQKMTVEHVTVNDGGQAIVGNVEGGGKK